MREQHHRQMCFPGTPAVIGAAVICLAGLALPFAAQAGTSIGSAPAPGTELAALGEVKLSGTLTLVQRAQRGLSGLDFYRGPLNGRLDRKTKKAVRKFQNQVGLAVDGTITLELVEILEKRMKSAKFLKRMERIETDAKSVAKQALLNNSDTRDLVGEKSADHADPTRDIADCLAEPTSVCLLREAAESAKAVHKDNMRDWALGEILVAQARADLKADAHRTAGHIQDPRLILTALKDAAIAHARAGRLGDALAAARRVPDDAKQLDAMAAIAEILSLRGENTAAERTLKDLLARANTGDNLNREIGLRARAARLLYTMGRHRQAAKAMAGALHLTTKITNRHDRAIASGTVAAALAEMGKPALAIKMLKTVRRATLRMPVLISAAAALAQTGASSDALAAAGEVKAARYRSQVLGRIAVVQARMGNRAQSDETLARALVTAGKVRLRFARNHAVSRIALDMVRISALSTPDRARRYLDQAEAVIKKVTDDELRAEILWAMVAERRRIDGIEAASATEARARQATDAIKSPLRRVWLLGDLANTLARNSRPDAAWTLFQSALEIARGVENTWSRARAFAKLSTTLASLRQL